MRLGPNNFVPADHYTSADYAKLEAERLWPRIWQVACREEQLPKVGSYVVYDIIDQSFIVMRTAKDTIKAFYNACLHRGRRLLTGTGSARMMKCPYHGWTYDSDGRLTSILCPEDYKGDDGKGERRLQEVRVGVWGGFVFINPDENAEPLEQFLDPLPDVLGPYDWAGMSYAWSYTIKLKCNWKTILEAFMESYHPYVTHSQINKYIDTRTAVSYADGKHGHTAYPNGRVFGWDSERGAPADLRPGWVEGMAMLAEQSGNVSPRDAAAYKGLMDLPATATESELGAKALELSRQACIDSGAKWPEMTPEQVARMGYHWNISPNISLVPGGRGASLVFRARPDGVNPDSCWFDFGTLDRFAPGKAPEVKHQTFEDWRKHKDLFPFVLVQDFEMSEEVQRGMRQRSFKGAMLNPVKENQIANLHAVIETYIGS